MERSDHMSLTRRHVGIWEYLWLERKRYEVEDTADEHENRIHQGESNCGTEPGDGAVLTQSRPV